MSWEKVPIKSVCVGIYDGPHATPAPSDSGAIFLGISNFKNGMLDLSNIRYISEEDLPKWTKRVVPKPKDIVFSYEATLNLYAIIPDGFRGCLGRRMALIRVDEKKIYYKFLYYYFYSAEWRKIIAENTILGATVDRIPIAKFPFFLIELPPIKIQHRIADILSTYDDLIENNKKQIKLLEEMAQRLYKEWFVDFRFPGYEGVKIVDEVPVGWDRKKISDFGKIITGKTPSTSRQEYYGGNIPFVKIPDMHNGVYPIITESTLTIEGANTQKSKFVPRNSIMVSCIATVGLVNIAVESCQTNQQINSIVLEDSEDLFYVYSTVKRLKDLLQGVGSNGATMTNVNKTKFGNLEVLYPGSNLRKDYYDFCEPIFRKIYSLSISNTRLIQVRDCLCSQFMSGQLEV